MKHGNDEHSAAPLRYASSVVDDPTDIATELLLKAVQRVLSVATECHRSRAPLDLALKMALDNLSIVHNDYQRCIEA